MFGTIKTLFVGANARAEETLRDTFAIELIDQKIREADDGLRMAKGALASLMQRHRTESQMAQSLAKRIADLSERTGQALSDGKADLAQQAAEAVAQMENELAMRRETVARLDARITRLRATVESGHRRLVDLRQGAIQARAIRREQSVQARLRHTDQTSFEEAEALIARVIEADDPVERADILSEINRDLNHDTVADRMADQGYGAATRVTAAAVLGRFQNPE